MAGGLVDSTLTCPIEGSVRNSLKEISILLQRYCTRWHCYRKKVYGLFSLSRVQRPHKISLHSQYFVNLHQIWTATRSWIDLSFERIKSYISLTTSHLFTNYKRIDLPPSQLLFPLTLFMSISDNKPHIKTWRFYDAKILRSRDAKCNDLP